MKNWFSEHPYMTFFLGLGALSAVVTLFEAKKFANALQAGPQPIPGSPLQANFQPVGPGIPAAPLSPYAVGDTVSVPGSKVQSLVAASPDPSVVYTLKVDNAGTMLAGTVTGPLTDAFAQAMPRAMVVPRDVLAKVV